MEQLEQSSEPPNNLQDALDVIRQWENGQVNLTPDGVAVARFLQQSARVGQLSTGVTAELAAV